MLSSHRRVASNHLYAASFDGSPLYCPAANVRISKSSLGVILGYSFRTRPRETSRRVGAFSSGSSFMGGGHCGDGRGGGVARYLDRAVRGLRARVFVGL